MVQIISSKQFDMQSFVFQRGASFDHHGSSTRSVTFDGSDITGLQGSYSFSSSLALRNGTAAMATADETVVYTGTGLGSNSAGTPNAGRVTGILLEVGNLSSFLLGTSIRAADIFDASRTTARDDDTALFRAALSGNDRATLSAFNDVIATQNGDDLVMAGAGDDDISGNSGADTLFGENGNDLLSGGLWL